MSDEITLKHGAEGRAQLDPELLTIVERKESALSPMSERGGGEDWDAPLDLRVARPRVTDLRAVWDATGEKAPLKLAGALGSQRPSWSVRAERSSSPMWRLR